MALGRTRIDEVADDGQGHVGFEQGGANFAQGRVDIGLGERTTPPQLVEYVAQTFAQTFEHARSAKNSIRPNDNRADARTFADQRSSPLRQPRRGNR